MEPTNQPAYQYLAKEVRDAIPMLYSTENVDTPDKTIVAKFFMPEGAGTWYVVEGSTWDGDDAHNRPLTEWQEGEDALFFGLVDLLEREWGYFTLNELRAARGPFLGLPIERDLYFSPKPASEVA